MIDALIRGCLTHRFLVVIGIAALAWGGYEAIRRTPVDAIPDIGEKQVIVYAEWPGRSPQDVDDQVTFPLTTSLTGTPGVKTIRSMSGFGFSMVFVIFEDSTDYYWARSRVLERMNVAQQSLPSGVAPVLGPDSTALGQVYWYTVEGEGFDLAELRSIQDWYVRYQLNAVEGVSEVASVGGFIRQYQIDVHPDKLRAHDVTLPQVYEAVRRSNIDVGAKVIEKNGIEFFVRGVGFVKSTADLENIVIRQREGTPVCVRNVATVTLGADFRRGTLDKGGVEAVGGVVMMRYGENPLAVVTRLKEKIRTLAAGLPSKRLADGRTSQVRLVPFYDRTDIVHETIETLKETLLEEMAVASLIIVLFLLHLRSAVCTLVTFPLAVAFSFILMWAAGVDSNIMSLAGLAIAIGDVGDMGIIMTENIYRRIATAPPGKSHWDNVYDGAREVGGAIVTAVANTIVSFVPVFALQGQEGQLFKPLAYMKTFAIGGSVVLALTVVPLMCWFLFQPVAWTRRRVAMVAGGIGLLVALGARGVLEWTGLGGGTVGWPTSIAAGVIAGLAVVRMTRERFLPLEENLVSRWIARLYTPVLRWVLGHKLTFLSLPALILFAGLTVWLGAGVTLAPVGWVANLGASSPRVEPGRLRWQTVRAPGERSRTRLLWRRQTDAEKTAESGAGLQVLREGRILPGIGREFMPPLDEGSILYMPSMLPQGSLSQAVEINSRQDLAIASVPEVASVVGKAGRADTALDPAPIGMFESIVILKPESEWRTIPVRRWFSGWPGWAKAPLAAIAPEERPITKAEILEEIQRKTGVPGVLPTFLQPIQTRLIMLQTGFRAMMGVKIYGSDLAEIERIGLEMEGILRHVPGATDVIADRIVGKPYIQIEIDRERIARYGINIRDVQDVIEVAIGGVNLMQTVEGRERYPVRVRYLRDFREEIPDLGKILVPTSAGAHVPLTQLADIRTVVGPQEIKGERGLLTGYVTLNTRERDEVSVVEDAEAALQAARREGRLTLPPGYYWEWSGQFENQQRATARMKVLVPLCLVVMFVMLFTGFSRWWIGPVIFASIFVSTAGGFLMLGLWGANLSVAVWVGFLVLFGVVDDDGVVMGTYLEGVFRDASFASIEEVREAVLQAGLKRIRPSLMTMATTVFGLAPIFWVDGRGSDVMRPMAIPSVGGMAIQVVAMFILPCLFCWIEERRWTRAQGAKAA
ncbi:MAG: efflux RND transporter permease subunit [Candidatus Brocadiae bacterium]|nr:efflux RND transporter permease subunit [Candidatus Brocadiia bacterium]